MAQPISYIPKAVDPRLELQRRLSAAPSEHAEALLVAYDLLEEAHRQGFLDALHGLIGAKSTVLAEMARYSSDPAGLNALRNLLAMGRMLGAFEPEPVSRFSKELVAAHQRHRNEKEPPTLWQILKRMRRPESRRGLSLLAAVLGALGRATESQEGPAR